MTKKIYITKTDYQKLSHMLREEIKNHLKNADYIKALSLELKKSEIVEPTKIPKQVATMNSKVRFKFLDSDQTLEYSIVFPEQADIANGKISILSPIATALIGYGTNDIIEWPTPSGLKKIKIEEIIYQPEAAGDYN
ncbi:MAG: nucleoside diphosphate kinase regulator [Patescibacteria group bacterium]|nr:nucleoside diphosphate kinase regulator [Patescibacteria group bacterium]